MQRLAIEWVVLTELTEFDATALGITIALQLGPQLFLTPLTGWAVDRIGPRVLIMITQAGQLVLGTIIAIMLIGGHATIGNLYALALLLGIITAFDAPARHAFVAELVTLADLPNAISLNSTSFHFARMIGPAIAGALILLVGAGWVVAINAVSFISSIAAVMRMRRSEFHSLPDKDSTQRSIFSGFTYLRGRADFLVILTMVTIIGAFGFNFAIYLSTMTTLTFGLDSVALGLANTMLAAGSVVGAVYAARREKPTMVTIVGATGLFGLGLLGATLAPNFWTFGASLLLVGFANLTFMTASNSYIQISVLPALRGRVMAIYLALFMGGTPVGAPLVGWIVNTWGARWGVAVGATAGMLAFVVGVTFLFRTRRRGDNSVVPHRRAETSVPISAMHAKRWSPRAFDPHAEISERSLTAIIEAARWAPSARNSQPWRFIVGRRGTKTHSRILEGLSESNSAWANSAASLIVNIAVTRDSEGKPLRWAEYDLGQAVAHCTLQAQHEGLHTHQVGGIDADVLRRVFDLETHLEPVSVTVLGAIGAPEALPDKLRERELMPRGRVPLNLLLLNTA